MNAVSAHIRLPNLKLRIPNVQRPSSTLVFGVLLLSYMLVTGGIVYDMINEPPSVGQTQENGKPKPQAVMAGRINGQYIIEGLSAGFLFAVGGMGFPLLMISTDHSNSDRFRMILLLAGAATLLISYNICLMFLRLKLPGYLKH
eukprot:NODE_3022_length_715_cov_112.579580_g2131_i0.p2 GENE.NODE_3022_length_715_cov_112.579580_g2131_i0~~NODE_3022_length_715_cov_112.579580_g2131_i0.p2  ORF type:complete len:144 (-),score=61.27 NODE_3022_length_715_cov_112.579580_g2131_i0:207-638(-)